MIDLSKFFEQAKSSKSGLAKLNFILKRGIPFNGPHKLKIVELTDNSAKVRAPFIRKNLNHIKGIHACCLATCAEYTTGLVMLSALDTSKHRLIMESIEVKYHYQGKMDCIAYYELPADGLDHILTELEKEGKMLYRCEVPVHDTAGNHICTGYINWQVKLWDKVKTTM